MGDRRRHRRDLGPHRRRGIDVCDVCTGQPPTAWTMGGAMLGLFRRRAAAPPQPTPSKARAADQCRREKQDTRLFARTADLAPWLTSIEEADGLSYRRLCALYHEFCELRDLQPLSEARFARELKAAGVLRYRGPRSSEGHRAWLYRVALAVVLKCPRVADDVRRVA